MVFSSATFLFFYLPFTLLFYYLTPKKYRNYILLCASLVYYATSELRYLYLLLLSCMYAFVFAIAIHKTRHYKRVILCGSIFVHIGILVYFKYFDFIIEHVNALCSTQFSLHYLLLPLGISFYTFQCLSYVIDVYKQRVEPSYNLIQFATYLTMFPQLVAGPIVRYSDIAPQIEARVYRRDDMCMGIERFIIGLSKKVILANSMGAFILLTSDIQPSVSMYWLQSIAFLFQLYFDFSGYSDMAIGLGHMFGFTFMENFNYPLSARSITDFWRRWHISLTSWFKDYVYIPLKGSRVKPLRFMLNILIVYSLSGLWHGARWNFILWGLYFGVILLIEKWLLQGMLKAHRIGSHIYTMLVLLIGFVLFQYDIKEALGVLRSMFLTTSIPLQNQDILYYAQSYVILFVLCGLCATPVCHNISKKLKQHTWYLMIRYGCYIALFLLCIAFLVDASFQPFLYFRF